MARHELRRLLDGFIGTLPDGDREILDMRLCGLSVPDIAEALDQPEGTVSSRVRRAEAALTEVAKRHQAAQRRHHGVAVLPLVMSEIMERVGADVQDVPEGMRDRVTELLRARLVGGARAPSAPRLPELPAVPARLGSVVTGIGGGLVALAGLVLLLLTLRGPSPSPGARSRDVTCAFAILVIVVALTVGLAFVWWMFSGAAAWIEPDERESTPEPLPRIVDDDEESLDD